MQTPVGFLVVESRRPGDEFSQNPDNPRYEGVSRAPGWPFDQPRGKDPVLWDYLLTSDVIDDKTNLIPSLDKALDVCRRLSQGGRAFEVIFCCAGPDSKDMSQLGGAKWEHLGYDIALITGSDYWSIVADFCTHDWAVPFKSKLNEHGLFDTRLWAEAYFKEYALHGEEYGDNEWDLVYVVRVKRGRETGDGDRHQLKEDNDPTQ
jgi:hypothetical protein